jgi:hypothetical protein
MPSAFNIDAVWRLQAASSGLTIATTAYTSGDVLGTEITFQVADSGQGSTGFTSGTLLGATVTDAAGVTAQIDLFLFDGPSTPAADNSPATWTGPNMKKLITVIPCSTLYAPASGARAATWPLSEEIAYVAPNGTVSVVCVTRSANAVFTAATDLTVSLFIEPDR